MIIYKYIDNINMTAPMGYPVKFLYRYAGYNKIKNILDCDGSDDEIVREFSEIFYHRIYDNGISEEYISVYSHNPLINLNNTTPNSRAKLVFPVFPDTFVLGSNSGLVELPIKDICADVNGYGEVILTYQEHNHPHYGLHFDENDKFNVDIILLSINEFSNICHPYKELK